MKAALKAKEELRAGLVRLAGRLLDEVEARANGGDIDGAVHKARTLLKRMRAWLRLLQGAVGEDVYRRENARLARAGRRLAAHRDRAVMRASLRKMEARGRVAPSEASAVARALARQRRGRGGAANGVAADLAAAVRVARSFTGWLKRCPWRGASGGIVRGGLEATHDAAGVRLRRWMMSGSVEDAHELRKRVKNLLHQVQLFERRGGEALVLARRLKRIEQHLGFMHDAAELGRAAGGAGAVGEAVAREAMRARDREGRRILAEAMEVVGGGRAAFVRGVTGGK